MAAFYSGVFWGMLFGLALPLTAWVAVNLAAWGRAARHRRTSKGHISGQYQRDRSDPRPEE